MEGSVSVLWWEEVRLCRCRFFFFFRKDEGRETRTEKQREKEGTPGARDEPAPTPTGADQKHAVSDRPDRTERLSPDSIRVKRVAGDSGWSSRSMQRELSFLCSYDGRK